MIIRALIVLVAVFANGADARTAVPGIIPAPLTLKEGVGNFSLGQRTVVAPGPGAESEARKLASWLRTSTGCELRRASPGTMTNCIVLELDSSLKAKLGDEGYRLSISPERVLLRAGADAGLFYAGITLRQLIGRDVPGARFTLPCVEIEDWPRFQWRGLLLDPARHFFPPEFVKKFIDEIALYKFNTLQLHLTDDQGWRIEIRKYPLLTRVGSVRKESPRKGDRNRGDGTSYGPFFYTQKQIRDLVSYAQDRHVTLVPEFEIPGHFLSALAAYPEFSCRGVPLEVRTRWGVEPDILCVGNNAGLGFVQDVLSEICDLFPSRFIHIGGDEAPRDRWKECPRCQARIKAEGLKNEAQLQSWLNARLDEFLAGRGRRLIGWDEILEGGLTSGAAVMSWRGMAGGVAAAQAGHDVVMSPTTHCYFDYAQERGPGAPESIGGYVPLQTVYDFEPVPQELPEAQRKHILGVQGNLWSEYMWTPADVEYFAFPRALALAEVAWSSPGRRDYHSFLQRGGDRTRLRGQSKIAVPVGTGRQP